MDENVRLMLDDRYLDHLDDYSEYDLELPEWDDAGPFEAWSDEEPTARRRRGRALDELDEIASREW